MKLKIFLPRNELIEKDVNMKSLDWILTIKKLNIDGTIYPIKSKSFLINEITCNDEDYLSIVCDENLEI